MHHDIYLSMHHIDCYFYIFYANLQFALGVFFRCFCSFSCVFVLTLAPYLGRLEPIRHPPFLLLLPLWALCFGVRKAKRKVLLDELNPAIKANFKRRGWLPLLDIDYPPPATLIREFYLNLSINVYNSNTLVKSWIQGVEFTITPRVVADALRVPVVSNPVYPYNASPPLDDIMSYITSTSIWWGSNPRITSAKLTETTYLFFRIACYSL